MTLIFLVFFFLRFIDIVNCSVRFYVTYNAVAQLVEALSYK
jgi:hypothetical protein